MWLIKLLGLIWEVNDRYVLPDSIDLIVPVSHGATNTRVTNGAKEVVRIAKGIHYSSPHTAILFGVFTESPNPQIEIDYKSNTLPKAVCVGTVLSTIEECMRIKANLPRSRSWLPKNIVLVTDQAHSRRARIVWRTFFPTSEVFVVCADIEKVVDVESPMKSYRAAWSILFFQAAPTFFFWVMSKCGPNIMELFAKTLHQPIAK